MNSPRPRVVVRITTFVGIAALMTACGSVHPGSAAVVDNESISMKTADEASAAYCKLALNAAAQQGVKDVSGADTRRQSIADLITYKIAKKVEKERGLHVDPGTYVLTDTQAGQVAKAFPKGPLGEIRAAIERSQETYAITIALGEASTGLKIDQQNQAGIQKAGTAIITKAFKSSDISIDPRFGLNDMTKQIAQTGSLSVPQVPEDSDPAALPPTQRCS